MDNKGPVGPAIQICASDKTVHNHAENHAKELDKIGRKQVLWRQALQDRPHHLKTSEEHCDDTISDVDGLPSITCSSVSLEFYKCEWDKGVSLERNVNIRYSCSAHLDIVFHGIGKKIC